MNLKIYVALLFWASILAVSCSRDDISFDTPASSLRFSTDTVFCDTVYNQVRSESYAFKVYNDADQDVMIPNIKLGRGAASLYRINVDGKSGTEFNNVPLRKKDSLYVFVEIAPTASGPESIAADKVFFTTGSGVENVTLFSVVQDAEFFVETSGNPNILSGSHTWNNDKAKIIFGDLTLATGATLNIESGTKVYFFKNSGLTVKNGATLNVNGDLNAEVVFRGDRNDPYYDTIPKNWNSMHFENGSLLNMNYARVFGGTRGLDFREASATIKNSIIHTFEEYGIHAVNSTITASNLVMNNCQLADLGIFKGGNYDLTHCTLTNHWRPVAAPSLIAGNEWKNNQGQVELGSLNLNIKNSILHSIAANAVVFTPVSGQTFSYLMRNCLITYDSNGAGYNITGNPAIVAPVINENPDFMNTLISKMNLRVNTNSPAKNKGNIADAATVPLDLVKISRTANPTLGAYQ